jgi:predicted nucleic acid-binding protein
MKLKVYIETTIPSFYHEVRTGPEMIARRQWTREWWDKHRHGYEVVTGPPVIQELSRGNHPKKSAVLQIVETVPLLEVSPEVVSITEVYIQHRVMPGDPAGDALHLALASFHQCDVLLTWNCRHLANVNKFRHIQRINEALGLSTPLLVTPLELIGSENDED